jgi:hypothetical protein
MVFQPKIVIFGALRGKAASEKNQSPRPILPTLREGNNREAGSINADSCGNNPLKTELFVLKKSGFCTQKICFCTQKIY